MMADAPNPNAAYAWLNFIHDPENQAAETIFTGTAARTTRPRSSSTRQILDDPSIFPPDDIMANLEGAEDTSSSQQRIDIWQEFKSAIGG